MMSLHAQGAPNNQSNESVRKVIYRVAPKYPPELKKNEIGGVVRLSIVINSRGSVERVSPLGGNPVLVEAATLAVRQWKYVPADHSTSTEIQLDFIPRQQ
jgi:TonB family protein